MMTSRHGGPQASAAVSGAVLCVLMLGAAERSRAEPPKGEADGTEAGAVTLSIEAGIATFVNGESLALQHRFKPQVRVEATVALDERLALGVEAVGVASDHEGYRLLGGYLLARAGLYEGTIFATELTWGFGAGTGPAILADDLLVTQDPVLWVQLGVRGRWWLGEGSPWGAVLEVTSEQLSVVSLVAGVALRL